MSIYRCAHYLTVNSHLKASACTRVLPPLPCLQKPDLPAVSHRGTLPLCGPSPPSGWLTPSPWGEGEPEWAGRGEEEGWRGEGITGGRRRKSEGWSGGREETAEAWCVGGGSEAYSNVPSPLPLPVTSELPTARKCWSTQVSSRCSHTHMRKRKHVLRSHQQMHESCLSRLHSVSF